jgi:2-polyprenyl-6-methoxyphenol hydroxylase-like FAD-dependent oxidoreductase
VDFKDPDDPSTCRFQVARIWKGQAIDCEGAEAISRMKAVTTPDFFKEPFQSAIQWMPEDSSPVFMRQLKYWPTLPWDNRGGRVTLAGDAAHCMLPSRLTSFAHARTD